MTGLTVKNLDSPDETRKPDKTLVEVVDLGTTKAARLTLQPGWKWSECCSAEAYAYFPEPPRYVTCSCILFNGRYANFI